MANAPQPEPSKADMVSLPGAAGGNESEELNDRDSNLNLNRSFHEQQTEVQAAHQAAIAAAKAKANVCHGCEGMKDFVVNL